RVVADLLVLRVARRKEVLRGLRKTAVDARDDRFAIDPVLHRLPRLEVVERRQLVVEREVVRVRVRVDPKLVLVLARGFWQAVVRDLVESEDRLLGGALAIRT